MTIVCAFSMGQGCMVSASRVCFAYARDDCYGFLSPVLKQVNRHTLTPVNAVWFNTLIGVLCMLLLFGGDASIAAIFSIGAVGAYIAFVLPVFIKIVFVGNNFRPGPWSLGRFSTPCGIISCTFAFVMMPIFCFPAVSGSDLTPDGMNWTCVVFVSPLLWIAQ
jgi:amino acid transporter